MFRIDSPRLVLIAIPLHVLLARLERVDFEADVAMPPLPGQQMPELWRVRLPAAWPGDALPLFPTFVAQRLNDPQHDEWGGAVIIDRSSRLAVGAMGCKGRPDATGCIEVGYGINPEHQGRGYATEILAALVAWLLDRADVRHVTAECLPSNLASMRVLEKAGFAQVGERIDVEDGRLLRWQTL